MKNISDSYYIVTNFGALGDGKTDDTKAVQACIDEAESNCGTAYFPKGDYLITETITFGISPSSTNGFSILGEGRGNSRSRLIKFTDGDIARTNSNGKIEISQMSFNHKGQNGQCLYLDEGMGYGVYDCGFYNTQGNRSDLLRFNGSYADIVNSAFGNSEPDSYSIRCTTVGKKLNINSNIFDCRIFGGGKGLIIDASEGNRPEGLKVSRNMFLNVGKEQITVNTILHVDISNNMLDQCSQTSVLLYPKGLGLCGIYLNSNYISPAQDRDKGIAVKVEENDLLALTINLTSNMIAYSGYGLVAGENARHILATGNSFNDITHDAVTLCNVRGAIVSSNTFWMVDGQNIINKFDLDCKDEAPVVQGNTTGRI